MKGEEERRGTAEDRGCTRKVWKTERQKGAREREREGTRERDEAPNQNPIDVRQKYRWSE